MDKLRKGRNVKMDTDTIDGSSMEQRKHVRIGNIAAGSWRQSRLFPYFVTFGRHADEEVE